MRRPQVHGADPLHVGHLAAQRQAAWAGVAQAAGIRVVAGPHRIVEHERVRPAACQVFRGADRPFLAQPEQQ